MRLIFFPDAEEIISNYLLHFSYKYLHASVSRLYLGTYSLSTTYISNIVEQLEEEIFILHKKIIQIGQFEQNVLCLSFY